MKKRIFSLLLALIMSLALLPGTTWAIEHDSGTCGDNLTWTLNSNGILTISGEGTMSNYDTVLIDSSKVAPWYAQRENIHKVDVKQGVSSIGDYAFYECDNLTDVSLPASVESIGDRAFALCESLAEIDIPDNVTIIDSLAFIGCDSLTEIVIPSSVKNIGDSAFFGCSRAQTVDISDGVEIIGENVFANCSSLTSIIIPVSVKSIGDGAFANCFELTDVYYSGTSAQWQTITVGSYNEYLTSTTIHYNSTGPDQGTSTTPSSPSIPSSPTPGAEADEYIYDTTDPGEDVKLPTDALDNVTDPSSAAAAVKQMTDGMTAEQKSSPTGIDLATLYAETAVSRAASKSVDSGNISINAAAVSDLASEATQAVAAVESALSSGGITTVRYLSKTVTFTTDETNISIQVNPDILNAQVDRLRVETPSYALTLIIENLKDDLAGPLTFKVQEAISSYSLNSINSKATVIFDLPKAQMTNPVIVSLPRSSDNTTYQAVVNSDGAATSSKLNPATLTIDGRINTSGTYTVKTNEKSFTDIANKSAEMQKAILYLTSKGIINGTSATQFSPDSTINRQQIAALIMRALGKVDNTATTTFTDVPASSSLYHAIASSQRHGIINGYSDNTFRGTNVISKNQIVTVSGRVLTSEMNYKVPANINTYLGKYSDSVPEYAQGMVALATREGLVVYRTDGTFSGDKNMTRGDAAIILYRLFQKIW